MQSIRPYTPVRRAHERERLRRTRVCASEAPLRSRGMLAAAVLTHGWPAERPTTLEWRVPPVVERRNMPIDEGNKAPAFSLAGDDGKTHKLADHKGKKVILYFYPRDLTPGCTTEACDFRDNLARIGKAGTIVYGVSKDSLASHAKFRDKHDLNFTLLSDPDLRAHKAYGAWGEKTMYGKKTEGVIRSTFLIDENGKLAKVWRHVKATGHVDRVLQALEDV